MNVIIFDKTNDADPTGVGVITLTPEAISSGVDLPQHAVEILPNGTLFEVVDDSTLPWNKPRELWAWQ